MQSQSRSRSRYLGTPVSSFNHATARGTAVLLLHPTARASRGNSAPVLEQLADSVQTQLRASGHAALTVQAALAAGEPSIDARLEQLRLAGIDRLLVIGTCAESTHAELAPMIAALNACLRKWRALPELRIGGGYHLHPAWVGSLAERARARQGTASSPLLVCFAGAAAAGYREQCAETARAVGDALGLEAGARHFLLLGGDGRAALDQDTRAWLAARASDGVRRLELLWADAGIDERPVCAAVNDAFVGAGGESARWLDEQPHNGQLRGGHARVLADIIAGRCADWQALAAPAASELEARAERARAHGATR